MCFGILQHFLKLWAVFNVLEESVVLLYVVIVSREEIEGTRAPPTTNTSLVRSTPRPRWWSNNSSSSFFFSRIPQPFTGVSATLVDSSRTNRELAKYNKKDHPSSSHTYHPHFYLLLSSSIFMDCSG